MTDPRPSDAAPARELPPVRAGGRGVVGLGLFAVGLVAALFLLEGRLNLNLSDEGFLWYGVERTAAGAVPMRDFYGYDPGRYYFDAAFVRLLGPGVMHVRLANAVFAAGGLLCGLLAAARVVPRRRGLLVAVGLLLVLWMYPRHKLFEPSLAMAAVLVGTRLLERPTPRRYGEAGAFVGVALFFGKNHALYAACAFAFLGALTFWKERRRGGLAPGRRIAAFALGGVVGALPLLGMLAAVRGFAAAYVDVLAGFASAGRTNLPAPFPWPWRVAVLGTLPAKALFLGAGVGLLALPLAVLPGLVRAGRTRREALEANAVLLAAAAVGVFYTHHAYARPDAFHLAQAIHPALLALVAWAAERRRRAAIVAAGLAALTLCGAVPQMPLVQRALASAPGERYVAVVLGTDRLEVPARIAGLLGAAREAVTRASCANLAVLPHLPGLYPALGRVSPLWDIYPIWPAAGPRDRRMRDELERGGVDCVLRDEDRAPLELPFEEAYPESAAWIARELVPFPTPALPARLRLLRRPREGAPSSHAASARP